MTNITLEEFKRGLNREKRRREYRRATSAEKEYASYRYSIFNNTTAKRKGRQAYK